MQLIALNLRPGPASSVPNVLHLPEVCPNHGKSLFPLVIEPPLERYPSTNSMTHRRTEPNLSSQLRLLPSLTMIENP
jgi:hypothetical protein